MPGSTTRLALPYPLPGDPFRPASVDFPALANALDAITARNPAAVLAAQQILEVGRTGQVRAGRSLAAADFTTLLGLSAPIGLYPLSDVNDASGNARNLTNKGAVPFGVGINGLATTAAVFAGSTGQALYIADTGAADPFRIATGSWGCWFRTAKRGTAQTVLSKWAAAAGTRAWSLYVETTNVPVALLSLDGTALTSLTGVTDVADDRWHFVQATFDGSVFRLYVDGALEASAAVAGTIFGGTGPLNVGAQAADGSTAAATPFFGRVDNAFVTADVLDEAQIRLLMAAKIAHGLAYTPTRSHVAVRRRKRGAALVTGDFSVAPLRLYRGGNAANLGSQGNTYDLTSANTVQAAGPDGTALTAHQFNGTSAVLSAADTGLPAGTASRTVMAWVKAASTGGVVVGYAGTGFEVGVSNGGLPYVFDGTTTTSPATAISDGAWHHVVATADNAAADGLKVKLYVDGRLAAAATTLASATLGGTMAIGRRASGTLFLAGSIARVAITSYAMTQDEISALFAKGLAIGTATLAVPDVDDTDAGQIVQGFDATNAYVLADVRKRVGGKVNSDGTIAEAGGGDFRAVRVGTGGYTIYFPPGFFTGPPVVTLAGGETTGIVARVFSAPTAQSVTIGTYVMNTGVATDSPFYFTAEGRGPVPSQHVLDLAVAA